MKLPYMIGGAVIAALIIWAQYEHIGNLKSKNALLEADVEEAVAANGTILKAKRDAEARLKAELERQMFHGERLAQSLEEARKNERALEKSEREAKAQLRRIYEDPDCDVFRRVPICPALAEQLWGSPDPDG